MTWRLVLTRSIGVVKTATTDPATAPPVYLKLYFALLEALLDCSSCLLEALLGSLARGLAGCVARGLVCSLAVMTAGTHAATAPPLLS